MKLKSLLLSGLIYSTATFSQDSMIVRFDLTPAVKKFLKAGEYDVTGVNLKTQQIEALLTPLQIQELQTLKANFHFSFPQSLSAGPSQEYKNPQEIEDFVKDVHAQYPEITELKSIGKSWEGRDIWAIKISDNAHLNEEEPALFYNGMHHAREVMTTEVTTDMISYLTENYNKLPEVTKWVNAYEIWVVPMYNVDGNNKMWTKNSMWRKNTKDEHGTDLNRNYPKDWNACRGSSVDPWNETFRGDGPASEPETKVMMSFVTSIKPVFSISYHSYSEMVLYPFGCGYKKTSALEAVETIGKEMATKLSYTPGTPWELLYNSDGGDIDWLYAEQQVLPYVIEVNNDSAGFHPDYTKWRNKTVELNRKGWMHLLGRMEGPAIVGKADREEYSIVKIFETGKAEAFQTYRLNPNGSFYVILKAGTYDFSFEGATHAKKLTNMKVEKRETISF
jgi:carboxypeptidase T